jgi:formylglycine-generating enzyme required for sulfatase activity
MVLISAGTFMMGCDPANHVVYCEGNQGPLHAVTLDAFLIDRDEVSNSAYQVCVKVGVCPAPKTEDSPLAPDYFEGAGYANFPVVNVSWQAAQTYCTWLGKRLPSEAEWEKAARGVKDTRPYPWGRKAPSCWRGNFISPRGACYFGPLEIGSHGLQGASPYGVLDLSGNVSEWVADWYEQTYYTRSPSTNPQGPEDGELKVVRGGSWNDMWFRTHLAYRDAQLPTFTSPETGFRCAATAP